MLIAGYETHEYAIPVAGCTLRLLGPKWPHAVHNDPRRQAYYDQAGYRPYWTLPWPAAVMLAEHVIRHVPPEPQPILELGAGLGLVGLALTQAGHRVIVTDCDEETLEFARASARLNSLELYAVRPLDWRQPPAERYATIVGAEILYAPEALAPVAKLLATCLAPAGSAYVSDANRRSAETFPAALHAAGLDFRQSKARAPAIPGFDSVDGRVFDGTVYHVFRPHDPGTQTELRPSWT